MNGWMWGMNRWGGLSGNELMNIGRWSGNKRMNKRDFKWKWTVKWMGMNWEWIVERIRGWRRRGNEYMSERGWRLGGNEQMDESKRSGNEQIN